MRFRGQGMIEAEGLPSRYCAIAHVGPPLATDECTKSCALPCEASACASKKRTCSCPNLVDDGKLCGVNTSSYTGHGSFAVEGVGRITLALFVGVKSSGTVLCACTEKVIRG